MSYGKGQEVAADMLAQLRRAHRMSCSDPDDPTKRTMYGDAASVIEDLLARLAAVEQRGTDGGEHLPDQVATT